MVFILLLASFLRLWRLGIIPVSNLDNSFLTRLPYAIVGIFSAFLIYVLVKKIIGKESVALWSAFWLSVNPWHIAESRIVSQPLIASSLLLMWIGILVFVKQIQLFGKIIISLLFSYLFYVVYPQFWIFQKFSLIKVTDFLTNFFKLLSTDFLFFSNDTFWWGGVRKIGTMLPLTFFFIIAGVYALFIYRSKRVKKYISLLFLIILLLSASSSLFPESREFFLATPLFAVVAGFGTEIILQKIRSKKIIGNMLLTGIALLIMYQFVIFWRLYTVHHAGRMRTDIQYVKTPY